MVNQTLNCERLLISGCRHVQEWKEHLEAQLDSLLGKLVRGTLRVLRGSHNRYAGGKILHHHCR